ncbi:hypothetical protein ACJ2A9_03725 [Anaerobacillus sp. MEB173]|uniref:hypothetical protein n=1 Tax=Anaerobacillus sp. MEB173 TaxID=3383345 RepID=UPI003F91E239
MDIFSPPNPSEGGYLYAFIVMYLFMMGAWLTVHLLRKANKKNEEEEAQIIAEQNNQTEKEL